MAAIGSATLYRLGDAQLTVEHPEDDIRGRKVVDKTGEDIGTVDDLMIDDRDSKVRFLRVGSGGILGIGDTQVLIPVDAITAISKDTVYIDHTRELVAGGPGYDPALVEDQNYWEGLYGYYGYSPFWSPGYMYPTYPLYPPVPRAPEHKD